MSHSALRREEREKEEGRRKEKILQEIVFPLQNKVVNAYTRF
jgi:hypothetical protein